MDNQEQFEAKLVAAEKDWDENGGLTLSQIKKKYDL